MSSVPLWQRLVLYMGKKAGNPREAQLRQHVANEAARIMVEQGSRDFGQAKRKAAARLGMDPRHGLPGNPEVETALEEYLHLFRADTQPGELRRLRHAAVEAMRLFSGFRPRLVGPVLKGTADEFSAVHLHLFAATPEQVDIELMERGIPFDHDSRTVRLAGGGTATYPLYRFVAGDITIELTVFPPEGLRQAPLSPVDGRPMQRAALDKVEAMLQE